MIVICGGLMRTGSVAMYQVMREIAQTTGRGGAPSLPHGIESEFFDEHVPKWAEDSKLFVLKLHRWRESLEPVKERVKVVMTIRDMRDVVVSLMKFRETTFEKSIHSNAFKGNQEGQAEWEARVLPENLMTVKYEEFVAMRWANILLVSQFMRAPLTQKQAGSIDIRWDVMANRLRAKSGHAVGHPDYMAKRHIHDAKVGKFIMELSPEERAEIVDRAGKTWFRNNGYEL